MNICWKKKKKKKKKEEGCCLLGVFNISLSLLGNHAMRIEIDYI